MSETKKEDKHQKPHTAKSGGIEQNSTTLDERLNQMGNEAIAFPNADTATPPIAKTETVSKVSEVNSLKLKQKPEVAVEATVKTESEIDTEEKSYKTPIALIAGIVVGALITYLIL